ncbi:MULTISPECIES: DNA-processing protein DprA [unclassified Pseudomonas]|uniref:DNA-processing protein DprA n=1 Tax=unclassified Pseudomonas TaxID=196821 RepID=UPI000BCBF083|nr:MULTISPECIES: DNA-processing protein DprA [unclassified Pseudomonas]PVZ10571.1 DNA processing protein [Pseudomonas sp. URIL14HWK12:I12]PVZ21997.1 DNA processing protein [Pseudomonas sp. URIL14HWK12:I10]PVZ30920.1 DNA processing protein [Pseudomonas sp. URIL14HWK12:I11]SNZ17296.1 DNA protecting protein DprA [Pseudomonas sp. URIL14HWK12:I9]
MPLFEPIGPSPAELDARLRLHLLPDVGAIHFSRLIHAFGSACAALAAPAAAWRALGLKASSAAARREPSVRDAALAASRWLEQPGRRLVAWDDPDYPALLKEIADPPPLLFVRGNPALLERPQLAIIGSRRASTPGLDTAQAFAQALAGAGFVVTSGLALGIDGAAHRGAIRAGGGTVAVLGTGLENIYPQRHKGLAEELVQAGGALISEYPLATPPARDNFPRRNRLISGLSLGVLVVEAQLASGSLITARLAAEQGREVYAVPGSIHHPGARGCHQLIRDGAQLVESVEHILEGLAGWSAYAAAMPTAVPINDPVLCELAAGPRSSEALARDMGWPLPRLLAALTELEVAGQVVSEAGRWFARPLPDTLRAR